VSTFTRTRNSKLGYNVDQVDEFLQQARRAYDADRNQVALLTAADIRHTAFAMQKGGYATDQVDAALERLEDAFALRERDIARVVRGDKAWYTEARSTAQVILNRLDRPANRRFDRTSVLTFGYNRAEVDAFAARLFRYFQEGKTMSVDDVRTSTFRPQRGGYKEIQVDLLLDSVTDVMLAVR
jgi:DivIVA domain-containing protein